MSILILGATGMLGQALMKEAHHRKQTVQAAARNGAEIAVDITDSVALMTALDRLRPDVVINTAAIISLDQCEKDPGVAYAVNGRSVGILANWCRDHGAKLVQISTDHYFSGDGNQLHDENEPVQLLNEYARTKYVGEVFALTDPGALVLRTNITGFRGWPDRPTFAEWAIESIKTHQTMTLFNDFFTSTIDVTQCSRIIFSLLESNACGRFNVACRESSSKFEFITVLAERLGIPLSHASQGSMMGMVPRRAESLGLDVQKVEALLGIELPGLAQVIDTIVEEYNERHDEI